MRYHLTIPLRSYMQERNNMVKWYLNLSNSDFTENGKTKTNWTPVAAGSATYQR